MSPSHQFWVVLSVGIVLGMIIGRLLREFIGPHVHRKTGWCGGVPYGALKFSSIDGLNHIHARVVLKCNDCGEDYIAAMVHLPGAAKDIVFPRNRPQ